MTDPIELTRALVKCPSVTPEEGGALDLLQSVLEPAGFTCHRMIFEDANTPAVDNLYARFGDVAPNLCFAGHTDVVPPGDDRAWTHPPFAAEIDDGIMYGRGTSDMKGAVAAFTAAALAYIAENGRDVPGSISLLITGDEEGPSINGTVKVLGWLAKNSETIDACLVGEPTNPERLGDEIKIGRRGSLNAEIVVAGRQGHAAYPQLAENPLHKLISILNVLTDDVLDPGTENFEPSSLQVTVLSVPNTATNVIPAEARAKFNIRYNDIWDRAKVEAHVRNICETAANRTGARYTLSFAGTGDVFLTKPGPLVKTMAAAVEDVTGKRPALTTGGGTSDARFIHAVSPVIEFGLINASIHKVDECVKLEDLATLTKIYRRFIEGYFSASR